MACYLDKSLAKLLKSRRAQTLCRVLPGLSSEEAAVLALLEQRPGREEPPTGRKLKTTLRQSIATERAAQTAAAPPS